MDLGALKKRLEFDFSKKKINEIWQTTQMRGVIHEFRHRLPLLDIRIYFVMK